MGNPESRLKELQQKRSKLKCLNERVKEEIELVQQEILSCETHLEVCRISKEVYKKLLKHNLININGRIWWATKNGELKELASQEEIGVIDDLVEVGNIEVIS